MLTSSLRHPPRRTNSKGDVRKVGVEIEFASVSAKAGAELVKRLFDGTVREEDPHRYHVHDSQFGHFTSELDTQYAHRSTGESYTSADPSSLASIIPEFQAEMRRIFGDVSSLVMPCEIVCPPIPYTDLAALDQLVDALVEAGATGTRSSAFYAFGAQLNPEIATNDPAWLAAMLKAYFLVSDWLREVISIDMTRQLVSFADPFPAHYVHKVISPTYWPTLEHLIDDYLAANPTRNRELDMLPLFMDIDPDKVRRRVTDARVKSRPTFHYRLPDANLGQPGWGVVLEWNRWCVVEELAEKRDVLDAMGTAYLDNRKLLMPQNWALKSSEWLVLS